jgi:hypothetical protein
MSEQSAITKLVQGWDILELKDSWGHRGLVGNQCLLSGAVLPQSSLIPPLMAATLHPSPYLLPKVLNFAFPASHRGPIFPSFDEYGGHGQGDSRGRIVKGERGNSGRAKNRGKSPNRG